MTIKRRLFISNILMIIIPILLSLAVAGIVMYVSLQFLGGGAKQQFDGDGISSRVFSQVETMVGKWKDGITTDQVITDMDTFYNQHEDTSLSLLIYENGIPLYAIGNSIDDPLLETALAESGTHSYVRDNLYIRSYDTEPYRVLLVDSAYYLKEGVEFEQYRMAMFNLSIILFLFVVAIIFITNKLLTRHVFRSIVTPLETLVYGVHQIRDGNLDYRIEYNGKDEFAQIVSDFNEMAGRLLDMVNARKKDDENRRELIAGISHDLRTPLTSIKAYVEGLEKGVAANPQMEKMYLDTIKSKTDDLNYIVTQLFQFSKLDIGEFPFHMERLDIGRTLADYVDGVQIEYRDKGLSVRIARNVTGLFMEADAVQLRSIFTNLLENAHKYGASGGGIVTITCAETDGAVRISFTDNGAGVPPETLARLFDVFYRNDKARTKPGQGSGLGLAISQKIAERFGGSIRAHNADGAGLCVEIRLPLCRGGDTDEKNTDY